jgi:hypothetical protein
MMETINPNIQRIRIELEGDKNKILEGLKKLYELGLKVRRIE